MGVINAFELVKIKVHKRQERGFMAPASQNRLVDMAIKKSAICQSCQTVVVSHRLQLLFEGLAFRDVFIKPEDGDRLSVNVRNGDLARSQPV
jgi:hypothetical protein